MGNKITERSIFRKLIIIIIINAKLMSKSMVVKLGISHEWLNYKACDFTKLNIINNYI